MEDHVLNHIYNNYPRVDIISDDIVCGTINCVYLESISQKYRTLVTFEGDRHEYKLKINQSKSLVKLFVKLVNNKFIASTDPDNPDYLAYNKYLKMYYIFNELLLESICYNRYYEAFRVCKSPEYTYKFYAAFFYYEQHCAPFDHKIKLILKITSNIFKTLNVVDTEYNYGSNIMIDFFAIKYNLSDHKSFNSNLIMILEQCRNSLEKIKHLSIDVRYQLFMYFYDKFDPVLITDGIKDEILCMFCGLFQQLQVEDLKN